MNAEIIQNPVIIRKRIIYSGVLFIFFLGVLVFILYDPNKIFSKYGTFTSISFIIIISLVSVGLFTSLLTMMTRGIYKAPFFISRFFARRLIVFAIIAFIIYGIGYFTLKRIGQAETTVANTSKTANIKIAPSITELGTTTMKRFADTPISIEKASNIASAYDLNGDNKNYHFALSFWVYILSQPPNTSSAYLKMNNVLTFCGSPKVQYNPMTNSFIIYVLNKERMVEDKYEISNVQLQKWNHFVLNYNYGIMDVFYNNNLVHSFTNIIPYLIENNSMLIVGQNNGIYGNMKNLIYFNSPLSVPQIHELYNQ